MKNLFKIILVAILVFKMSEAEANVGINPYYIVLDGNSSKRNEQVFILNTSKKTITYRIKLVNYKQLSDGNYQKIEKPEINAPFASPYLVISPNQTTLNPGQSQTIRIQRKPMLNAEDGEYISRLMVSEVDTSNPNINKEKINGIKIEAKALSTITIPIIIHKGKLNATGEIKDPKIITKYGKKFVVFDLIRKGTKSLFVNINIKDANGKRVGSLNKLRVYLTTPNRNIEIPLENYKSREKLTIEVLDVDSNKEISTKTVL